MDSSEKADAQGLGGLFDRAHDAGALTGKVIEVAEAGKKFVIVPDGYQVQEVDNWLAAPRDLASHVAMRDLQSFIDYLLHHKSDDSAVFADVKAPGLLAILDWHGSDNVPTKRQHRAAYKPELSEEWKAWTGINGKWKPQVEMVRFMEEQADDIVTPDGATLLEVCATLEAKKNVTFKSGLKLADSTVQMQFIETTEGQAGGISGQLSIPTELTLGMPVFYAGDRYSVKAFFRYNINGGALALKIDLHQPQRIIDDAFGQIVSKVIDDVELASVYQAEFPR